MNRSDGFDRTRLRVAPRGCRASGARAPRCRPATDPDGAPATGMVEPRKVAPRANDTSLRASAQDRLAAGRPRRSSSPSATAILGSDRAVASAAVRACPRTGRSSSATNGDIFRSIRRQGEDRADRRPERSTSASTFSRDGTQLVFLAHQIDQARTPASSCTSPTRTGATSARLTAPLTGLDWQDWSPDGSRSRFVGRGRRHARHQRVERRRDRLACGPLDVGRPALRSHGWPPTANEMLFRGGIRPTATSGLHGKLRPISQVSPDWATSSATTTAALGHVRRGRTSARRSTGTWTALTSPAVA